MSKKQSEMKKIFLSVSLRHESLPGVDEPSPNKTLEVTVHIIFKPLERGLIYGNEQTLTVCYSAVQRTFSDLTNLRLLNATLFTLALKSPEMISLKIKNTHTHTKLFHFTCVGSSKTFLG